MAELLNCPFCGGKAVMDHGPGVWREHYRAHCDTAVCMANPVTQRSFGTAEQAAEFWNRRAPSSPSIEREAKAPSIEVPPGMSRIDAFFWLEHRADVIEALAQKGLRVVSNADRVWLAPIEREVSGEARADDADVHTVHQGWKLVPVKLTPEMEKADPYGLGYGRLHAIWSRLLDAAPAACVTPCDGGKNG